MTRRAAVIGAGPAGCAAAWRLAQRGRSVVLFEAAERVGGRTTTWREGGHVVDSGAGFFTDFYPTLRRLLAPLGLRRDVVTLSRSNVLVHEGRTVDFTLGSVRSFARYPFVGRRAKLRMIAQTAIAAARYRRLELARPDTLAPLDDRSVREDAIRRLGEQAYEFLVRPGIEPFWYFSCADVSRALSLALLARAATARFFTLRDGMDSICRRLARDVELRAGIAVDAITRASADGARLVVRAAGREERVDEVIVATTATAAARITATLGDDLVPPTVRRFLETQRYVPNVHAAFTVPRADCPPRTSAMFPCGPRAEGVAAIAFNGHKGQGAVARAASADGEERDDEIVSVFLAAAESAALLDARADDDAIARRAWALARALCPTLGERRRPFRVVARREAIPLHAVGRYRDAAEIERAARGPIAFAGDYLATATVDGALRSGLVAADAVAARR